MTGMDMPQLRLERMPKSFSLWCGQLQTVMADNEIELFEMIFLISVNWCCIYS
jgi:hypothetical protein